ncbi:hypothetical protein FJ366_02945, partial [Candidatus Dependentiae bacterium]|nr:hypothetical protein [Candidatus Dependentiae bacterium]
MFLYIALHTKNNYSERSAMRSLLSFYLLVCVFFSGSMIRAEYMYSENYNTLGWQPIQPGSQNASVSFTAKAGSDIFIAFQYDNDPNKYLEINLGGWGNSKTAISQIENGVQSNVNFSSLVPNPITQPWASINYVATIENNLLTITSNGAPITRQDISFLEGKNLTGYSFKGWGWAYWELESHKIEQNTPSSQIATEKQTTLSTNNFNDYGWKPITTPSNNLSLSFEAIAQNDIHIGLQYSPSEYIFIAIGGWYNTQGCIRKNIMPESIQVDITAPSLIIPMPNTRVKYVISITTTDNQPGSTLTVTANERTIYTVNLEILKQNYTHYSFRSWPPSTVVLFNETINTSAASTTLQTSNASTSPQQSIATQITVNDYNSFGWKNFPTTQTAVVSFQAKATGDIHVAFQYEPNSYFEIVVGGWGNTQSAIREYIRGNPFNEQMIPSPSGMVIPDTNNFVNFTVKIQNNMLTVMANNKELFSQYIYFINNKSFNAYSFKAIPNIPWMMQNDMPSETTMQQTPAAPTMTGPQQSIATQITVNDYNSFGWKNFPTTQTAVVSFQAKATGDIHVAFQYEPN